MIAARLGHDGQQRQFSGAVQLFGEITVENVGAPCMAGILQPADGLHGLARWENMPIHIGWRGIGDSKRSSTDLCRGELAIEGGAVRRCAPVARCRVARPAGFCRPTKPVVGARQRNRVVGDFGNPCKVSWPPFVDRSSFATHTTPHGIPRRPRSKEFPRSVGRRCGRRPSRHRHRRVRATARVVRSTMRRGRPETPCPLAPSTSARPLARISRFDAGTWLRQTGSRRCAARPEPRPEACPLSCLP